MILAELETEVSRLGLLHGTLLEGPRYRRVLPS
jgi:hypothetical protein